MCSMMDAPGYWRGGAWHQGEGGSNRTNPPEACEIRRFRPRAIRK